MKDLLLVAFVLVVVAATVGQITRNADTGPRGRAPHSHPVSTRVVK